ncbi:MAG: hypothetical protein RQ982_10050 [Gammaproteobacteria bacterium]|nr:hypothetical protein [Gammaproteobacteria bacterium]
MTISLPLNMDFSTPVCPRPGDQPWINNPAEGVSSMSMVTTRQAAGYTVHL